MIWVLVPAYNEAKNLSRLLTQIDSEMRTQKLDYRLLVVDDGSIDDTAKILVKAKEKLPLTVISHLINRGLGETERDAFEFVAFNCDPSDLIVRVEGDATHDPKYIPLLLKKIEKGYDVVNTSRFQTGGGQKGISSYRNVVSLLANFFMKTIFPIPGVRDFSCGYRAYRVEVIQDAIQVYGNSFIQLKGLGFTSTLEIIVKLYLLGCRFHEIPFVLRYDQKRGKSKMVTSTTTLGYLTMAVLFYWPFGGWSQQYRGLRQLYRKDRTHALKKFKIREVTGNPL